VSAPAPANAAPPDNVTPPRSAMRSGRAVAVFMIVFVIALAADLLIKHWAFNQYPAEPIDIPAVLAGQAPIPDKTMTVVPGVLAIKLTLNQGAVFGMFQGQRWFFIGATFIAIGVVAFFFAGTRPRQWVLHVALALVLAGAMGNLYDRMLFAAVRDMFWLLPGVMLPFGWQWPGTHTSDIYPWLFNAADAFLLIGIITMLAHSLFVRQPNARNSTSRAS